MDTQTFHSLICSGVSHAVTESSDKTKVDQSNPKTVGGGGSSMKLEHKELVSLHLRPSHIQQLTIKVLTNSYNKNYESNHAKG